MTDEFFLLESSKVGLESDESFVVVRNRTAFLRVLGAEPEWSLMTATADEDHGRVLACADQRRLVEAALRLGAELNTRPTVERDRKGREYVKVCVITRDPGQSDEAFDKDNQRAFGRFFEIFDSLPRLNDRPVVERRNLYDELALGDHGEDVYLSDGVWLGSDGSLHDRGR
ncbi:hypothetical protein [Roseateles toxinivorans]|uniref:hypothetical protein n=1 Tax=Roseateles toxinivorans TaxID=270368 RepID=UPI00105F6E68|nr:hypothetical protein [Roseateles toxinivorans]